MDVFDSEYQKPMIDQVYRTYPFRECTAVGGASMGGLMALYGAIKYNRWFSKAACISSAVGHCLEAIQEDFDTLEITSNTRLFLS